MRYAVVDSSTHEVENVMEYDDGEWSPPEGTYIIASEECGIGDFYDQTDKDFYRSMKNLKPPEDEVSILQRKQKFELAKAEFKSKMLAVDPHGKLTSI